MGYRGERLVPKDYNRNVISQVRTYQGKSYKANIIFGNDNVYAEVYFDDAVTPDTPGITMSKREWASLPFAEIESV